MLMFFTIAFNFKQSLVFLYLELCLVGKNLKVEEGNLITSNMAYTLRTVIVMGVHHLINRPLRVILVESTFLYT